MQLGTTTLGPGEEVRFDAILARGHSVEIEVLESGSPPFVFRVAP